MASWGDMAGKGITLFGGLKRENCIQFVENKIVKNLTAVDATITLWALNFFSPAQIVISVNKS